MIKNFGLTAFLLLALFLSVQIAPAQDGSASDGAAAANSSSDASLQGIWKANLGEKEIVIAISQSGEALFGLAKFEGDNPWNGAVSGAASPAESSSASSASLSSTSEASAPQGTAFLSLAALEGDAVTSTFIRADVQDGAMLGIFIRTESNGMASRGDFAATMISPDTSAYTPATVASAQSSAAAPAAAPEQADQTGEQAEAGVENENDVEASEEGQQDAAASGEAAESRFKDVTKLAKGINPNILPRMAPL
ncbi:MAG TPA: hypothetical protein PKK11_03170 [Methanothrix sp.]|nr:hypothetical protein [Methanothrix sp.]HPT19433.1 hypothetical protein [Methanothrix sp.]